MTFTVLAERCDQCLYGPNKIVTNERRAEILNHLNRTDSYFICHKASIAGVEAVCRGDWDQRYGGQLGRIMGRLDMVTFIPEADLSTLPPAPDREEDEGCPNCRSDNVATEDGYRGRDCVVCLDCDHIWDAP